MPLIARWPGRIAPATTSDHVSAFWDFLPTAASIAGVAPPAGLDGISYLPALTGGTDQGKHDYLYWEFTEQGGKQAIRQSDWKAVRLNVAENPQGPLELYNLTSDPSEEKNVGAELPDVVAHLAVLMAGARTESALFPFKPA
ncbi:MAG: hypothetical protein IT368_05950 [Candidatus Hydrogenedentes bacterium]|nr:hypothetical protein [Candidatus Hydrogenedentota bacterium]